MASSSQIVTTPALSVSTTGMNGGSSTNNSPNSNSHGNGHGTNTTLSSSNGGGGGGGSSGSGGLTVPYIHKGWFTEMETMWPGQKFSLALEEFSNKSILFQQETDFQSILVFRSAQYGNVLVLDGVIQLTERDEFAYHEMMTHLPLCSHPQPRRVLIVGGGDGGILREVLKHESIEEIVMVEIDPVVVEVAMEYFAESTATHQFQDTRLTLIYADAAQYLTDVVQENEKHAKEGGDKKQQKFFDIIIGDTSDPVGPAESLFQPAFYEAMYTVLAPGGIVCVQGECFWIHLDLVSDLVACCHDIFDHAEYAITMVPTYPCGQIGFVLASKDDQPTNNGGSNNKLNAASTVREQRSCRRPVRTPDFVSTCKWYSPEMHRAAFLLPPFVAERIETYQVEDDEEEEEEEDDDDNKCFLTHGPSSCVIL